MNWSRCNQSPTRTGIKQSISHTYQVWCPHVAQGLRPGTKQAQATSLAAPSYAPGGLPTGGTLLPDDAGNSYSHGRPCAPHGRASSVSQSKSPADVAAPCDESEDGAAVATVHAVSWALSDSDSGALASCAGEAGTEPVASGDCSGQHAVSPHLLNISSSPAFAHMRPPADRTAEASSSCGSNSSGMSGISSGIRISSFRSCSSTISVDRSSSEAGKTAPCNSRHLRRQPGAPSRRSSRSHSRNQVSGGMLTGGSSGDGGPNSTPDGATTSTDDTGEYNVGVSDAAAGLSPNPISTRKHVATMREPLPASPSASAADGAAAAQNSAAAADANARRKPLTLERLREQTPGLTVLDMPALQQRLIYLSGLLQLDDTACLMLCRVVPGLLLVPPSALRDTWDRLCITLGGEETTRGACAAAPLLLVLPPDRVPACIASLTAATAMPRAQAAALVAEWPQLATHAPASLAAKLEGLRELLLGTGTGSIAAPRGGSAAAAPVLRAALRVAPRLLTFSTAALARHYAELGALLGSERLSAALRREPGLLLQRPSTVAAKMALLQQLMDCAQHPGAVAALVVRQPGVLRRSLAALSRCCRALSIWRLCRRDKLRIFLSRPRLITLPPEEVHGRCRWLRRLMLSNAYYHAALRRLPPSLVGVLVAALPLAWARLLYLAESSQECRMHLMDVVECRHEDFATRFPEFTRWLQFKIKLMGADNPWRGTHRIRGFTAVRDKPTHGAPSQLKLRQRQQQGQRFARYREQQQEQRAGPSVSVVLAEAGEVRSGGSTVARPRRVLRQLPTAVSQPTPEPLPSSSGPPSLLPTAPPLPSEPDQAGERSSAVLTLPPVGIEVAVAPTQVAPRRRLPRAVRLGSDEVGSAVTTVCVVLPAAVAAELPR